MPLHGSKPFCGIRKRTCFQAAQLESRSHLFLPQTENSRGPQGLPGNCQLFQGAHPTRRSITSSAQWSALKCKEEMHSAARRSSWDIEKVSCQWHNVEDTKIMLILFSRKLLPIGQKYGPYDFELFAISVKLKHFAYTVESSPWLRHSNSVLTQALYIRCSRLII